MDKQIFHVLIYINVNRLGIIGNANMLHAALGPILFFVQSYPTGVKTHCKLTTSLMIWHELPAQLATCRFDLFGKQL